MSGFLIDTNVLSEYYRAGTPDPGVRLWLETTDRSLQHVSVITLAEIDKGVELPAAGKRRSQLEQWPRHDARDFIAAGVMTINPWKSP